MREGPTGFQNIKVKYFQLLPIFICYLKNHLFTEMVLIKVFLIKSTKWENTFNIELSYFQKIIKVFSLNY